MGGTYNCEKYSVVGESKDELKFQYSRVPISAVLS